MFYLLIFQFQVEYDKKVFEQQSESIDYWQKKYQDQEDLAKTLEAELNGTNRKELQKRILEACIQLREKDLHIAKLHSQIQAQRDLLVREDEKYQILTRKQKGTEEKITNLKNEIKRIKLYYKTEKHSLSKVIEKQTSEIEMLKNEIESSKEKSLTLEKKSITAVEKKLAIAERLVQKLRNELKISSIYGQSSMVRHNMIL